MKTATYLKKFVRENSKQATRIGFIAAVAALCNLLSPWPLKILADCVLAGKPFFGHLLSRSECCVAILLVPAFYIGIVSLRGYLNYRRYSELTDLGEVLGASLGKRIFSHTLRMPFSFHDRASPGELATSIISDVDQIKESFIEGLTLATAEVLTLVGGVAIMWRMDRSYAVLTVLILSPLYFVFSAFPEKIKSISLKLRDSEASRADFVQERLASLREIKLSAQEDRETSAYSRELNMKAQCAREAASLEGRFIFWVEIVSAAGMAIVLSYGGWRAFQGSLSLGDLLVFIQYLQLLYAPVGRLSRLSTVVQKAVASSIELNALTSVPQEGGGLDIPSSQATPALELRDVYFSYTEERRILRGVNLKLDRGERVGIIGPTGSGKSTLTQLLTAAYPPEQGSVQVEGLSVEKWSIQDLRNRIAVVSQEPRIFRKTIEENIRYARPDADMKSIIRAADLAGIHDFIAGLPSGYQTEVGAQGVTLSGGERQRIALARAILKDSPILILDEPTSAIDEISEKRIIDRWQHAFAGRTVLIITHRPSILKIVDRICRLSDGTIRNEAHAGFTAESITHS